MSDNDNIIGAQGFDTTLLDPTSWQEQFELLPVKIVKAGFRWSSDAYNAATKYRPAFPRPIQQFVLDLERHDAEIALLDGNVVPAVLHAGVDLEGWNREQTELVKLMQGRGKAQLVISEWVAKVGSLVPDPSHIEGQNWMVKRFATKKMGGVGENARYANNIVLPDHVLPPDYVYTGTKTVFQQKRPTDDTTLAEGTFSTNGHSAVDPAAAAVMIGEFVKEHGVKLSPEVLGHPAFPAAARIEPFVTAIAIGSGERTLAEYGVTV